MIFGFHSFQQVDFKKSDYFLQKKIIGSGKCSIFATKTTICSTKAENPVP